MMPFYDRIRNAQRRNDSLLCVGLDSDLTKIPRFLFNESADPILEFNRQIIEATKDLVCSYKLNLAFYESLGEHCWGTVHQTLALIPPEIVTIGDAKRGDIENSSEMYARSLFQDFDFTATTVSPYMGSDSVQPFLSTPEQGAFVLALTSNPGAKDFQYLKVSGKPLYEHVVKKVKSWNGNQNCGLVVGATRPKELKKIREIVPDMPLLIPGVGAQGGNMKNVVRFGCDKQGEMAIVNLGRSVLYSSSGKDFADAARLVARALKDEINSYRQQFFQ